MAIKRGNEATFAKPQSERVQAKDVRLSLKEGESQKVIICTKTDYVEYPSHNSFNMGIFPQSCHTEDCPLCKVASMGEEYKELKVKPRYKFAFYVIAEKKIMVFDATAGQARKLNEQLKDYAEDIDFGAVFTFKRTGTGKDTAYTLSLISERKYTADDKKAIEDYKGFVIEDAFFEDICSPVSRKYIYTVLRDKTDLDVYYMFADAEALLSEEGSTGDAVPMNDSLTSEDDLPF